MAFSAVGRTKVIAHVALLLTDIVALVLAARVNLFQDFFFIADLFPLALSIVTLVLVIVLLGLDFALENSYTGRPQFEIGIFGVLSIFWLAFNAFSTSRWRQVPFQCNSIPSELGDELAWCKNLQALKSFVWINFVVCFFIAAMTLRYAIVQYYRGNTHIFKMPLSRYRPELRSADWHTRDSEFLQFEKLS